MNTKKTIGERLVQLREKLGLSQAQVASSIGVDRTSYAKYESNVNKPTRKLEELSKLFHVTTDYIMCLSEHPYDNFLQNDEKHPVVSGIVFSEKTHVAATIKSLRIQNNLTQEELAERLGVRQQTIGKWESAITVPRWPMLKKIGNFFGVSTDYLLGQKQESFSRPMSVLEQAEKELDEDDLQQLEALAKYFLKKKRGVKE